MLDGGGSPPKRAGSMHWRAKLAAGIVAPIVAALVAEAGARAVWGPPRPADADVVPRSVGRFDERLGWSPRPGAVATSRRTGYPIEYRINSKGLRDDETTYEKPLDVFRIVVLGDSRTFGFGVPIEKHFTTLLEGYFERLEVINLGVVGYGVDQELLFLRHEGLRYGPDLVIAYVAHYGDRRHMHAERFGKQKPVFVFEGGELVLTNTPVPAPPAPTGLSGPLSTLRRLRRWLDLRSTALDVLADALTAPARPDGPATGERRGQDAERRAAMYAKGEALVAAIRDEARAGGAEFLLVTQIEDLHAGATRRGITSLDVGPALANPRFELPDGLRHVNEAGNGVLAWELARFLVDEGLVPREHGGDLVVSSHASH